MVVTPSSSQSHPTLHVPSTEPLAPPVLNVRRPKALRAGGATGHSEDFVLATAVDDTPLPPTVLRLPNLADGSATESTNYSIASMAHWVAIVLGGLIALWLIFGGRRGEMPDPDAAPLPARAEADSATHAWVPPPLESAGDSSAPAWTPPKATSAPAADAAPPAIETPSPTSTPEMAPAFNGPESNAAGAAPTAGDEEPQQEAWPRPATSNPNPSNPTTTEPSPASTPELAPAGTSARNVPPGAASGPAVRTAQFEPHVDPAGASAVVDDPGASEVQPLGITVPVPQ